MKQNQSFFKETGTKRDRLAFLRGLAAAMVLFASGAAWAQSGAKGTQGNPYDWSSMALQLQNADIPAGAYIKTASGKIRPVTAGEIDWAKKEARKKGVAVAPAVELSAQELLDKGKAAQTAGKQVEALSYFIRASNRDPSLTEAVNLANVTTANISSGNIGADTRNAIAWRKAWVALLDECDQYVANYVKTTPLPTYLVYSTDIQQGEINWEKETTALSFDISLFPDQNWPAPITGVVDAVYKGLVGTGQTATWKLDWPVKNASGGTSQVTPKVTVKYNVAVQLLNDQGALLGTQAVPLSAGWKVGFRDGKASSTISRTVTTVTFPAVDANRITDKLTIIVVSLDGQSAETAARTKKVSIMTYTDYQKPRIAAGLIGPAGGEIIVVDGKKLEVAPVFTEFMAHWSDAIARCKSLKVNGIGGWHLPTKEELDAMYQQLHKQGLGGFSDSWYWSSSEYGIYEAYEAWDHNFDDGHQLLNAKRYRLSVRAVREL